jgi:Skp family chaperone for outer membrane proteins
MGKHSTPAPEKVFEPTSLAPSADERTIAFNRISWGAVLAGVVLALVSQLMLNLLGVGIGVATFDSRAVDAAAAGTFSIAAGVWYVIAGVIAAFAGGYFAGRLSGSPLRPVAAFHGITTWAVTTLVVLYLLTTAVGSLVGGVFSTVSGAIGGLGRTAATVVEAADPFNAVEQEIRRSTGGSDPQALRDAAVAAVRAAFTGSEQLQEARGRAAEALAKAQNISVEQARSQVQQYEEQYRAAVTQARQRTAEAADTAAAVVSRSALFGFFALLLGAVAGWLGGSAGTVPSLTAVSVAEPRRNQI